MDRPGPLTLPELARAADVTPRTIRYYISQGLLPSPVGSGSAARYTQGHLVRLRMIRRLADEHVPLARIRERLADVSDQDVARLVDEAAHADSAVDGPPQAANPALAYIDRVLGRSAAPQRLLRAREITPPFGRYERDVPDEFPLPGERPVGPTSAPAHVPYAPELPSRGLEPDRSTWERIALAPDIELHVRRPLDRPTNKRLERLLAFARELFAGRTV